MNDTEGALVGERYRLDQPIGRGRAGIVWLAFDTMLHRTVAAKRLHLDPRLDRERAGQTALEQGRRAMHVVHPNAVTVYDVFRADDDVWLIMEYVPSRNMADFLSEHGTLTPEQAAYLGTALGSALVAAHDAGVPHGRVEPGNVLLADDGSVKVTDIGIHDGPADLAFRAPEFSWDGRATPQADAYSLGATLFTAVEGTPPFGEDGTEEPAVPDHSGPLTGALLKLLRADPDLRPTLTDTVKALRAINKGNHNAVVPPTAPAMPTVPLLPRPPRVPPTSAASVASAWRASAAADARRPGPRVPRYLWAWSLLVLVVVATVLIAVAAL